MRLYLFCIITHQRHRIVMQELLIKRLNIDAKVSNGLVFVTDQHYVAPLPLDITSYYSTVGNCGNYDAPLYASSNTLPQNAETVAFITLTHDRIGGYENKTWVFTHDLNVCGSKILTLEAYDKPQFNTVNVANISRINPAKIDLLLNNYSIAKQDENCDQDPD
jgi:hypothetical protein